jgi:hypothetical protein
MFKSKYFIGCLLMTAAFSCKKEEDVADKKGSPDTMIFTNNTNTGNMPANSVSFPVVNIPDVNSTGWVNLSNGVPATIKIPVFASKPVNNDVTVTAELDNSLVAVYNAAHSTGYVELPAGYLNTQGLSARIPAGQTVSTDSISIAVSPADLKKLTSPSYMAPIKLTTISDPAVGKLTADTTIKVVYVVFNVELRQIKYLGTTADITGTLQTKTNWVATLNPTPTAQAGNILDGSTTTFARYTIPTTPVLVDLDMLSSKNVTAFRLFTVTSTTYTPPQIDVLVSDDGINYKAVGTGLKANVTFAAGYSYIVFYKAIPARYLRLNVTYNATVSTSNGRLAELDVYAN